MSCSRTDEAFGDTLSAEYQAHLSGCDECKQARAAYEAIGHADVAPVDSARLEAARQAAQAELALHPRVRPWWLAAVALLAFDGVLAVVLPQTMSVRTDSAAWVLGLAWWGVAAAAAFAALVPGRPMLRWAAAFSGACALLATLAATSEVGSPGGISCAQIELGISLLPAAAALGLLMRFAFDPVRAAIAGMGAAAVGVGVLCVHCPSTAFAHVLLFHLAPWLAVIVVAVAARRSLPSYSLAP